MENAIDKVIKLAGSKARLARALMVSPQTISQWEKSGTIPVKRCSTIEELYPEITRQEMRPDHFGEMRQPQCTVIVLQNFECDTTTL